MPHYFIDLLVLILIIALPLAGVLMSPRFKKWYTQKKADRKIKLAHSGKLKCEYSECNEIAIRVTPNGYFCEWHWEPMSIRKFLGGGHIIWSYKLSHAVRRS